MTEKVETSTTIHQILPGSEAEAIGTCLDSLDVDRTVMSAHTGSDGSEVNPIHIDRVLTACDQILA